jgi:thymidylate synthase
MLCLTVEEPMSEPRIHRAFPGGVADLIGYVHEVVDGSKDHLIDMSDPQKWHYTYHQRMTSYPIPWVANPYNVEEVEIGPFNQLENCLQLLAADPYTRRAQAITWNVATDATDPHCPCMQRLWFRVFNDRLVMNLHIRSNDAYKAAFMNMYAMTELQAWMSTELSERLGREILPGQYNHIADSFHIYGSYFEEFKAFESMLNNRTFADRTWNTTDDQVWDIIAEAHARYEGIV